MKLFFVLEVALAAKRGGGKPQAADPKECFSVGYKTDNDMYIGDVSQTTSGNSCLRWKAVKRVAPTAIKDAISNKNYDSETPNTCRNPDNDPNGPWCYYGDPKNLKWEYCDVPSCRKPKRPNLPMQTCLMDKVGENFSGTVNKADGDKPCQAWAHTYPHFSMYYTGSQDNNDGLHKSVVDGLVAHDYCRNPDKDPKGPWCYLRSTGEKAYCNIPVCKACAQIKSVKTTNEFVCGKSYIPIGFKEGKEPTDLKTLFSGTTNSLTRSGGCRRRKRRSDFDSSDYGDDYFEPEQNFEDRIVGGEEATENSIPWQVSVMGMCGGTIVTSKLVVTAAHCVDKSQITPGARKKDDETGENCWIPTSDHEVIAGLHHKDQRPGKRTLDGKLYNPHRQDRTIGKYCYHKQYRGSSDAFNWDAAVIYVDRPFELNNYVAPACLTPSGTMIQPNTKCLISGWGNTDEGKVSPTLQMATVDYIDEESCKDWFKSSWNVKNSNAFCAGYAKGGVDACQGDSGGPLVCKYKGDWMLTGIVSKGDGCGAEKKPGFYARVAQPSINTFLMYHVDRALFE